MNPAATKAKRVALVTCEAFANLYEDDHLLVSALVELGIQGEPAVWSRAEIDWAGFDAIVMRSPWDYFELERISQAVAADSSKRLAGLLAA